MDFLEYDHASYLKCTDLTQHTAFYLAQSAGRRMKAQGGGGKIILTGVCINITCGGHLDEEPPGIPACPRAASAKVVSRPTSKAPHRILPPR